MQKNNEEQILGDNIRALRLHHGLSQKAMAKEIGISVRGLTQLESGIIPPRLECTFLFHIHRRFGIRPAQMFTQEIVFPNPEKRE